MLHAVDDVSFTIARREIVALVGESGSGKSTIARLLAMVYKPTSGEIRFEGNPLSTIQGGRTSSRTAAMCPMVFQDPYSSINPAYRVSHGIMRAISAPPARHRPAGTARRGGPGDGGRGPQPGRGDAVQVPLRAERWPAPAGRLRPGARAPARSSSSPTSRSPCSTSPSGSASST